MAIRDSRSGYHVHQISGVKWQSALQLYHGYGSKHLIETIHAFGICVSYTEVRQFLTSAANHEIAKTEVSCIPYGISPKTLGGDFIQEGADNIDLNTETIDGKILCILWLEQFFRWCKIIHQFQKSVQPRLNDVKTDHFPWQRKPHHSWHVTYSVLHFIFRYVNDCFTSKPTIYFNCPMHCLQNRGVACCKILHYFFSFIPIHFNHIYLANL